MMSKPKPAPRQPVDKTSSLTRWARAHAPTKLAADEAAAHDLRARQVLVETRLQDMKDLLKLLQPGSASDALGLLRRAYPEITLAERVQACKEYTSHRR